jgi:ArsR family metal-binding transcriptional regulator
MTTKVVGQSLPRVDAWDKNDDILLRSFRITHVLDCIADPTKNRVIAEFSDNIAAVFPYLLIRA